MSNQQVTIYRRGVDIVGPLADLLPINETTDETDAGKLPLTPASSSIGALDGDATRHLRAQSAIKRAPIELFGGCGTVAPTKPPVFAKWTKKPGVIA